MDHWNFFSLQLFALLAACIFTVAGGGRVKRLVGGENVLQNEIPYQVSLRVGAKHHICGGAIISNRHILSAAHCVCGLIEEPYDDLTVVTGTIDLKEGGETHTVDDIYCHPRYVYNGTSINDLVVITVKNNITINKAQAPIALPKSKISAGKDGLLTGWGRTNVEVEASSRYLKKLKQKILDATTCQKYHNYTIMPSNLCGYVGKGRGPCKGDSGGPLAHNNELIGIFSWTKPCALGYPDVYTSVYDHLNFINGALQNAVL